MGSKPSADYTPGDEDGHRGHLLEDLLEKDGEADLPDVSASFHALKDECVSAVADETVCHGIAGGEAYGF